MTATTGDAILVDRTGWRSGPWDNEPDKVSWTDEATGLPCLIVRNDFGALCGYVGVPNGHRLYGLDYNAVEPYPDVHGGLTYADKCRAHICHTPPPGQSDDVWWFGFDTAHGGDLCPGIRSLELGFAETLLSAFMGLPDVSAGDVYRDLDYVRAEVTKLATQLAAESVA